MKLPYPLVKWCLFINIYWRVILPNPYHPDISYYVFHLGIWSPFSHNCYILHLLEQQKAWQACLKRCVQKFGPGGGIPSGLVRGGGIPLVWSGGRDSPGLVRGRDLPGLVRGERSPWFGPGGRDPPGLARCRQGVKQKPNVWHFSKGNTQLDEFLPYLLVTKWQFVVFISLHTN